MKKKLNRLRTVDESTGLRVCGVIVLVAGRLGSGVYYAVEERPASPAVNELSASGYLRTQNSQLRLLMGIGVILMDWREVLERRIAAVLEQQRDDDGSTGAPMPAAAERCRRARLLASASTIS